MLLYNYKKEFIGIDTNDLKKLGLKNLADLHHEAADFADLFVKTPGYVHNFKHVHWIDFIAVADSTEEPKAIINIKDSLFHANLHIHNAYLADAPDQEAYIINLVNLRALSHAERANISAEALDRPIPQTPVEAPTFVTPTTTTPTADVEPYVESVPEAVVQDEYDIVPEKIIEDDKLTVEDVVDDFDTPLEVDNFNDPEAALEIADDVAIDEVAIPEESNTIQQTTETTQLNENLESILNSGYVYDPQIASNELGLPLDLIEEFIQDFIAQAKEFQPKLYEALDEGDIEQVKILSHKLKGVAANLRIEDALEVLTTVNTTSNLDVIRENLSAFYIIIARLAGEDVPESPLQTEMVEDTLSQKQEVDDDLILDFKEDDTLTLDEDPIEIQDEDVPTQIDLPELADDDFTLEKEPTPTLDLDNELELQLDEEESVHFSQNEAAAAIGVDQESFQELLQDYLQEAHELVDAMKTSVQNNDTDFVTQKALQLKGMSENIRLTDISHLLQEILAKSDDKQHTLNRLEKVETILNTISN